MALKAFEHFNVDVAILEVGMGGTYDATNVVTEPAVSAITHLGKEREGDEIVAVPLVFFFVNLATHLAALEHVSVLGPDLKSITAQKAGIMRVSNIFLHDETISFHSCVWL